MMGMAITLVGSTKKNLLFIIDETGQIEPNDLIYQNKFLSGVSDFNYSHTTDPNYYQKSYMSNINLVGDNIVVDVSNAPIYTFESGTAYSRSLMFVYEFSFIKDIYVSTMNIQEAELNDRLNLHFINPALNELYLLDKNLDENKTTKKMRINIQQYKVGEMQRPLGDHYTQGVKLYMSTTNVNKNDTTNEEGVITEKGVITNLGNHKNSNVESLNNSGKGFAVENLFTKQLYFNEETTNINEKDDYFKDETHFKLIETIPWTTIRDGSKNMVSIPADYSHLFPDTTKFDNYYYEFDLVNKDLSGCTGFILTTFIENEKHKTKYGDITSQSNLEKICGLHYTTQKDISGVDGSNITVSGPDDMTYVPHIDTIGYRSPCVSIKRVGTFVLNNTEQNTYGTSFKHNFRDTTIQITNHRREGKIEKNMKWGNDNSNHNEMPQNYQIAHKYKIYYYGGKYHNEGGDAANAHKLFLIKDLASNQTTQTYTFTKYDVAQWKINYDAGTNSIGVDGEIGDDIRYITGTTQNGGENDKRGFLVTSEYDVSYNYFTYEGGEKIMGVEEFTQELRHLNIG